MKIINFLRREISKQFLKFCLIGLEKTILTYIIFLILFYFFRVNYMIAAAIGFIIGVLFGFIFDKTYTFNSKRKSATTLPKYFLVYLFTLGFNLVFLRILVETRGINPIISNLISQPFIVLVNFLGTKIFVFKNRTW